jgi:hypothetical protein
MLLVGDPGIPSDQASYSVELSFDGRATVSTVGLGRGGVIGIRVGRGEPTKTLAAASALTISVEGHAYSFSLRNAGAAVDAVARCVGVPTFSEEAPPPQPISGAGRWTLTTQMPGVTERACSSRAAGDQIDVILLLNKDHQLVLMGGHPDWATWGGQVPLELSIDGGPPTKMTATQPKT